MESLSLREWALLYAENGYKIFRLKPGLKEPATKNGVNDATDEIGQIEKWWENDDSNWNIGLSMGSNSGLIGIDIDFEDGADRKTADKLPPTYTTYTPRGGRHPYFRYPDKGIKNNKKIAKGFTVRSNGYYFVLPPSIFTGVGKYTCTTPLWKAEIADCPQWIVDHPGIKDDKTKAQVGSRHSLLLREARILQRKGCPLEEMIKKLTALRDTFPNPQEKTDSEILKICDWVNRNIENEKEIMEVCIDDKLLLFSRPDQISIFEVSNKEEKIVEEITEEKHYAVRVIAKTFLETYGADSEYANKLPAIFSAWKKTAMSLSNFPKAFCWPEDNEWCFKRLTFSPEMGAHPTWDEFLSRIKGAEEFQAYVWSIFEEESDSRQFLYLYGPHGNEGKSSMIRVIASLLGNGAVSITNNAVTGDTLRWLPALLYGKRLVTWADCKNPKFAMSETLRNFTSGDNVVVERKGKPVFHARMRLKMIIASNEEPQISDEGANTSRLIRVDIEENKNGYDPGWEKKLREELPYFLYTCRETYRLLCPDNGNIRLSSTAKNLIQDSTAIIDSEFDHLLDEIEFGAGFSCSSGEFSRFCSIQRLNNFQVHNLKQTLLKKYGIKFKCGQVDGKRYRAWIGMKLKTVPFGERSGGDQDDQGYTSR